MIHWSTNPVPSVDAALSKGDVGGAPKVPSVGAAVTRGDDNMTGTMVMTAMEDNVTVDIVVDRMDIGGE